MLAGRLDQTMLRSCFRADTTTMALTQGGSVLQNFDGGGATFHCFITAYGPELDAPGPETRPGGRPGPRGACYVLRRYMPFSGARKGLNEREVHYMCRARAPGQRLEDERA